MGKLQSVSEYEQITSLINRFPEGVSIDDINSLLKGNIARRTLQRRLSDLVSRGAIRADGEKKARRYYPENEEKVYQDLKDRSAGEHPVYLSQAAIDTHCLVRKCYPTEAFDSGLIFAMYNEFYGVCCRQ